MRHHTPHMDDDSEPRLARGATGTILTVLFLFLASAVVTPVQGQQDAAFLHGLTGDETSWPASGDVLEQEFSISALYPDMGWPSEFQTQESRLDGFLGARQDVVAAGHSNGGIVARFHAQRRGFGANVDRILTVQTASRGAPLADAVLAGLPTQYASFTLFSISDAVSFYSTHDPNFDFIQNRVGGFFFSVDHILAQFLQAVPAQVAVRTGFTNPVLQSILDFFVPVLDQMGPSRAFIQNLNSSGRLSTESSATVSRVGIATEAAPSGVVARLLFPGELAGLFESARWTARQGALLLYSHYVNHPDPFLSANAGKRLQVAQLLTLVDVIWLDWVGVLNNATCFGAFCFASVDPSDGVVPFSSAQYPGATNQRNLVRTSSRPLGILHIQLHHPDLQSRYDDVFAVDFGIPRSGGGGGGGDIGDIDDPGDDCPGTQIYC